MFMFVKSIDIALFRDLSKALLCCVIPAYMLLLNIQIQWIPISVCLIYA